MWRVGGKNNTRKINNIDRKGEKDCVRRKRMGESVLLFGLERKKERKKERYYVTGRREKQYKENK